MAESKSFRRGESVIIRSSLLGSATSLLVTVFANAFFAWLVVGEKIQESAMGYGTMAILLIASVLGAIVSIKLAQCKQMVASLVSGLLYFGWLLLITVFFYGGNYNGVAVTGALIAAGSVGTAFILPAPGQKAYKRAKKKKHR